VNLNSVIEYHEKNESDMTLLLKPKKEYGEQEKKIPEGEIETEIDNVLIGDNN
jgi:hypothetical protein